MDVDSYVYHGVGLWIWVCLVHSGARAALQRAKSAKYQEPSFG